MPRLSRRLSASGFYHVIIRGNGRQVLFEDDADRHRFLDLLHSKVSESSMAILAWCLMSNHVHLVVADTAAELSRVFHKICCAYAQYFNTRGSHVGHVFQDRFASRAIESEAYLLRAIRYVHDNPAKAGICPASSYEWSSFREYVSSPVITDTTIVLDMLGGSEGFLALMGSGAPNGYHFDGNARISDQDAADVARFVLESVAGPNVGLGLVKAFPPRERSRLLSKMRREGLCIAQIERLTGIGSSTIKRATVGCKLSTR